MSNRAMKIAVALSIVLTLPAASFARGGGGHGGGHGGFARLGGFGRLAGSAGTGNVPISGIPRGPANAGGLNNATVDPSGLGNAFRIAPQPQPHMAVSTQPGGSPAARRSSAIGEQPEESERSHQSGERGARPHDQWHLSRLLSNGLFPDR